LTEPQIVSLTETTDSFMVLFEKPECGYLTAHEKNYFDAWTFSLRQRGPRDRLPINRVACLKIL
jgi:hypothetical protein